LPDCTLPSMAVMLEAVAKSAHVDGTLLKYSFNGGGSVPIAVRSITMHPSTHASIRMLFV